MYSPQLLDHFEHPRNAGAVAAPDGTAQRINPACGDTLRLTLRLEGERIAEIRFQAKGCVAAVACASALTEMAAGKTLSAARALSAETLVDAVGGLPAASSHAAQLAVETLGAALEQARPV